MRVDARFSASVLLQARDGLPFGSCVLFDQEDPLAEAPADGSGFGQNRLSLCYGKDKERRPNLGDTGESLCVQFLALAVFPRAEYVCSDYHAGQTQVTFGSDYRRRADCLISVEEDEVEMVLRQEEEVEVSPGHFRLLPGGLVPVRAGKRRFLHFLNYHGMLFHGSGTHLPSCSKYVAVETGVGNNVDDDDDDADADDNDGDHYGRHSAEKQKKRRKKFRLSDGFPAHRLQGEARKRHDKLHNDPGAFKDDQDLLKEEYAAALTAVEPDLLCIRYQTLHECQLLHSDSPPDPALWNDRCSGGSSREERHNAWKSYKTVRDYLKHEFSEDSLLGTRRKAFTQDSLVAHILKSGYNSLPNNEFGGFVVISGGRESKTDDGIPPQSWGFCHQRTGLTEGQVGNFTKLQARMQYGGDAAKAAGVVRDLAARDGTLVRTSFSEDGCNVLSMDYFRFLLHERSLVDFRLLHCLWYRHKHWLDPFIREMLQRRHELKNLPDSLLFSILLKLLLNGERERERLFCL